MSGKRDEPEEARRLHACPGCPSVEPCPPVTALADGPPVGAGKATSINGGGLRGAGATQEIIRITFLKHTVLSSTSPLWRPLGKQMRNVEKCISALSFNTFY